MDGEVATSILSRLHDAVVSIDRQQRIVFFNDAAESMFGYRRAEILGQSLDLLIPEARRAIHNAHVTDFDASGEQARMMAARGSIEGRRRDGSTFPAAASITEVGDGDGVVFTAVLRDITEQRAIESQLRHAQRMESIGQLTGGIAHDFNNLLAIMVGNLDLAKERIGDHPAIRKQIDSALNAALRGAELVQRLLAFARRQALAPDTIDLNRHLPDVIAMLQRALGDHIDLNVKLEPELWLARVDPTLVDDALLNLAINARDAMPNGGNLTIETQNVVLDETYAARNIDVVAGDYVMIAVSDTGIGMPPEVVERVFEPFFTTKGVGRGTGLGLSMVYGFVKQSGGHIKIYSEPGHGTCVRIYLPRSGEPEQRRESAGEPVEAPRGAGTVLLAEDNAEVRATAEWMLTELGYQVHAVADGPAALHWLDGGARVDLLLTDVVMPGGINGYELAEEAVKRRPGLKILLTTGYTETSMRNGRERHAFAVLSKPYNVATLAHAVQQALCGTEGDRLQQLRAVLPCEVRVVAETHPLFGRLLAAKSFKRWNGVLLLVIDLPDGSPGTIRCDATDVLGVVEPGLRSVLDGAGLRALHRLVAQLATRVEVACRGWTRK